MTTLYTIELRREHDGPFWAFVSHRNTSLVTEFAERAGLFTEADARMWIDASLLIKRGWRADVRVATAEQITARRAGAAA